MRHYEMMVILSDELDNEAARALLSRIETFVADNGGTTHGIDEWGKRALAYEIAHRTHGFYAVLDIELDAAPLAELERQLKINDGVVRIKTIRPDIRVRRSA